MIEKKLKKQVSKFLYLGTIIMLFFSTITSCKKRINPTIVNNGIFSLNVPNNVDYKVVIEDSNRGKIIFDNADTLYYSIGYIVHSLSEEDQKYSYMPLNVGDNFIDSARLKPDIHLTARKDYDNDKLRKQNVFFKRIAGKPWIIKYTIPVDTTKSSLVGIYIDSLGFLPNGNVLKFNAFFEQSQRGNFYRNIGIIKSIELTNIKSPEYYNETLFVY